jgi:hypothetical protein
MANTDSAYGFKPWGPLLCLFPYSVDSSNGTAFFQNDLVELEADGNATPSAAASLHIVGSSQTQLAVSTAGTVMVADGLTQKFDAQADDVSATLAQTNVGNLADHIAGAGSAVTLLSGHEIDSDTAGAAAAALLIQDSVNREDNDNTAANADWICVLSEHIQLDADGI